MKKRFYILAMISLLLAGCGNKNSSSTSFYSSENNSSSSISNSESGSTDENSSSSTNSSSEQFIKITNISLDKTSMILTVNEHNSITATISPSNATYPEINYKSDNNSIASINQNGEVTATGVGETDVYAYPTNELNLGCEIQKCHVVVNSSSIAVTGVNIDKEEITLTDLSVTDKITATVLPTNASNKAVKWSSSDYSIASVSGGVVTPYNNGDADIMVKTVDGEFSKTCIAHVRLAVKSVSFASDKISIQIGKNYQFVPSFEPAKPFNDRITYSVEGDNGTITQDGLFTASKVGICTVKGVSEDGGHIATCEVTVSEQPIYYNGYYEGLTWTNSNDLINKLNIIIRTGYKPLKYAGSTTNWASNQNADQALDDFESVDQVYDINNILKTDTNKNGRGWQREHAFCASLMTGSLTGDAVKYLGRATDFHNLFASSYAGNTSRGNKNYGVADPGNSGYRDLTVNDGADGYKYDALNFEPANKDKGRLARAIFYMCVMYKDDELDDKNDILMKGLTVVENYVPFVAGEDCSFSIGNLSSLLTWANNIPVDRLEMQHNVSVYKDYIEAGGGCQGNRNPFVDYPELVDYAFGSKKNSAGSITALTAAEESLLLSSKEFSNYAIKTAKRQYSVGQQFTQDDYEVIRVNNDFSTEPASYVDETPSYTFTESDIGNSYCIVLLTDVNNICYLVAVKPVGIESCSYFRKITGKTEGQDFNAYSEKGTDNIYNYCDKDNPVTLVNDNQDGQIAHPSIDWISYWKNGMIASYSATAGVTWGSQSKGKTNQPCELLRFTTVDEYDVKAVYIAGNTGAGKSYTLSIYIGEEMVYTHSYAKATDTVSYGVEFVSSKHGQVKFEITGINGSVIVYGLGIDIAE